MHPSVVLISVYEFDSLRNFGTGFVVASENGASYVVTCDHVVSDSSPQGTKIFVQGQLATIVDQGRRLALDLAILKVPGLTVSEIAEISLRPAGAKTKLPATYSGYSKFYPGEFSEDYRKCTLGSSFWIRVPSPDLDDLRIRHWVLSIPKTSASIEKGHSGSPILDRHTKKVVAVARMRDSDGRRGYAIDIAAVAHLWPDFVSKPNGLRSREPRKLGGRSGRLDVGSYESGNDRPPLPPPPFPVEGDDPQKGRWGEQSEREGRKLEIRLKQQFAGSFTFDAIIESTVPESSIEGPFVFHLHHSYPRQTIWIRKVREGKAVLEDVHSYGVYTIGAQVKNPNGKWISLEYDLSNLPGLNVKFKAV